MCKGRTLVNDHENNLEADFPEISNKLSFLGLMRHKSNDIFCLRGKLIKFCHNSKRSMKITIHNIGEFETILQQGKFRKT